MYLNNCDRIEATPEYCLFMSIARVIHYLNDGRSIGEEHAVPNGAGGENEEMRDDLIRRLDFRLHLEPSRSI